MGTVCNKHATFQQAASIQPTKAGYNTALGEFIYLYEDLRQESSPDEALLAFLESSYEAGATLAQWDRSLLERASLSQIGRSTSASRSR